MGSEGVATRVLSLDGGGVRGLSSLIILEHLLNLVQSQLQASGNLANAQDLLASELFDHIVGTSTGGLIAVMLVKLNMRVSDCINAYRELLPEIFGRRQFGSCVGGLGVPRYSDERFRKCIQIVFDKYGKRESGTIRFMEEANIGNTPSHCTVVCRELHSSGRRLHQPAFICSHYCRSTQKATGKYTPYELWATCRATTAAPTFFSKITINDRIFVDGAFGNTNNPTRKAHFHFISKVPKYKDRPVIWLNIGTGSPKPNQDSISLRTRRSSATIARGSAPSWRARLVPKAVREATNLLRDLQAIATDSDRVEEEMEDIISSKSNTQHIVFSRISPNNGVADVQLDDWRNLDKIDLLTRIYLEQPNVQDKLRKMADLLAQETLCRRKLCKKPEPPTGKLATLTLPWLNGDDAVVSPLPSPAITLSRPDRESQHTADLMCLSPLDPSPIFPMTTVHPIPTSDTQSSSLLTESPVAQKEQNSAIDTNISESALEAKQITQSAASDLLPSNVNDRETSPTLLRQSSQSTQDLFADMNSLPGMTIPNYANEMRFSNSKSPWNKIKGQEDKKWKRRTTMF